MHIEIHLPRPGVMLLAVAAVSGWAMYWNSGATQAQLAETVIEAPPMQSAVASVASETEPVVIEHSHEETPVVTDVLSDPDDSDDDGSAHLTQTEMRIKWARAEQEFLRGKQEIIRDQLQGLQKERDALGTTVDSQIEEQFRRSVQLLTSLVKDQQKAEEFLLASYRQEWEAEEHGMAAATGAPKKKVGLFWPVEPGIGISAFFLDPGYKVRFKVEHYAVDIPVAQGTDVLSAADGIVKDVIDHGLGYNYVTVDHGGYATVYGHISEFNVRAGQRVRAGDVIGKSGGMPGLKGGGLSTGPHLHFGLYIKGVPVDPLLYLPKRNGL